MVVSLHSFALLLMIQNAPGQWALFTPYVSSFRVHGWQWMLELCRPWLYLWIIVFTLSYLNYPIQTMVTMTICQICSDPGYICELSCSDYVIWTITFRPCLYIHIYMKYVQTMVVCQIFRPWVSVNYDAHTMVIYHISWSDHGCLWTMMFRQWLSIIYHVQIMVICEQSSSDHGYLSHIMVRQWLSVNYHVQTMNSSWQFIIQWL